MVQNRRFPVKPARLKIEASIGGAPAQTERRLHHDTGRAQPHQPLSTQGAENTAFAPYFDGASYLNMLSTEQVPVGCVTFAPGCRNHWHIHRAARGGGQILLVTAGRGWYQEWGEAPRALHPGDVVNIPPNVKHWHGAAVDSAFQHLAVEVPGEGSQNEWCEPVDAASYRALEALTGGTDNQ